MRAKVYKTGGRAPGDTDKFKSPFAFLLLIEYSLGALLYFLRPINDQLISPFLL